MENITDKKFREILEYDLLVYQKRVKKQATSTNMNEYLKAYYVSNYIRFLINEVISGNTTGKL